MFSRVAEDHIVHFIMDAVCLLRFHQAGVNPCGSAQYQPA